MDKREREGKCETKGKENKRRRKKIKQIEWLTYQSYLFFQEASNERMAWRRLFFDFSVIFSAN